MRVLFAFICVFLGAGLFLFPITESTYDFKTDVREDSAVVTTIGGTTGSLVLVKPIYDDDTSTLTISSNLSSDTPTYLSYNTTSRLLSFSGLTTSSTRLITVDYDVDALADAPAISTLLNLNPFLWYAFSIVFIGAAIAAMVLGRA